MRNKQVNMGRALRRGTSYKEELRKLQTINSYKLRDFIFLKDTNILHEQKSLEKQKSKLK